MLVQSIRSADLRHLIQQAVIVGPAQRRGECAHVAVDHERLPALGKQGVLPLLDPLSGDGCCLCVSTEESLGLGQCKSPLAFGQRRRSRRPLRQA